MSTPNRASLLTKIHRVLKKHSKRQKAAVDDRVLNRLLFACLLEDAPHAEAERCLKRIEECFFDLNEVRVTSVRELSEALDGLPDPASAASRLRQALQNVFESRYSYDLEHLKKDKLGAAEKQLERLPGVTPFAVAYVTQSALGGHAIALDRGSLGVLSAVGAATEEEVKAGAVRGLTRAISKSKGEEFFYFLHELGAEFLAHPNSRKIRSVLLSIAPGAEESIAHQAAVFSAKPDSTAESNGATTSPTKREKKTASSEKSSASSSAGAEEDSKSRSKRSKAKSSAVATAAKKKTKKAGKIAKKKPR